MNCAGKIRVYRGEYGYSTSFGVKKDDEYVANVYLDVVFTEEAGKPSIKKEEVQEIEVVDSFLAGWQSKNSKGLKLVVLEWEKVKASSKKTTK